MSTQSLWNYSVNIYDVYFAKIKAFYPAIFQSLPCKSFPIYSIENDMDGLNTPHDCLQYLQMSNVS